MREIIGIDGCPSGWILAYFRESHIIFEVIKSLEELNKKKNVKMVSFLLQAEHL